MSAPRPAPGPAPSREPKLRKSEIVVLKGLAWGKEFAEKLSEARAEMPPGRPLWELFEHPSTRQWVETLVSDPSRLVRLRESTGAELEGLDAPELAQVRSIITEALMGGVAPCTLEEFEGALNRQLYRCRVRFSQHIKKALGAAEANEDAELHARLSQELIDLQRKIKEFAHFYDDAE